MIEIFHLASVVKFDLGGQRSFGKKVAYLTKGLYIKEIVLISIIVSELRTFEIFNLTLEVEDHSSKKLHISPKDITEKSLGTRSIL